ncbi:MAG: HAD-IA family hydrolase [Coriobacteriia bacterium]
MSGSSLKAVSFDVGNTLLYPHPSVSEVVRQVLAEAGHARDLAAIDSLMPLVDRYYEDRYRADDTFWTSEEETSGVWVGMYSLLCARLGIEDEAPALARRVYDEFGSASRWRAYPDVRPAFERLRARDLRIGIVSNWDSRLEGLLDGLGLSALIDVVVSSASVGLHKPDPRIFELACERMGVSPSRAVHVGDHVYSDIVGATAVGMNAVLIDRHGTSEVYAGISVSSLDDLDAALAAGGLD